MSSNSTTNIFQEAMYYNNLNILVTNIFLIVTSAIGIPGNLISILVFSRLIRQKSNMGLLCTWQSLIDLFLLVISLVFTRGSRLFFDGVVFNWSDGWCKAWSFWRRYSLHLPSWVALITTFDRFTFVLYENRRFKFMRDKRIVCLIILVTFLVLALLNYPNIYAYIPPNAIGMTCTGSFAVVLTTDIISGLLRTFIPMTLMLIFNYRIFREMRCSRGRATSTSSGLSHRERHFTRAVIFTDVVFFITKLPLFVCLILYDAYYFTGVLPASLYLTSLSGLLNGIFIDISYVDQIFSFFMHLAFNKLFRKELVVLIKCFAPSFMLPAFGSSSVKQRGTP